jgi:CDP-2,3-bis-(O-geranylgeranyl)-sn-glycerol synthase
MTALRPVLATLLLVVTANLLPWLAGRLRGRHGAVPLDFGLVLPDGARLFGAHKTWRGVAVAVAGCAAVAALLGYGPGVGAAFGALAMAGDAASSGVKRRLKRPPGTEIPGLDQLPEALLPALVLAGPLGIGASGIVAVAAIFLLLNVAFTRVRQGHAR